MGILEALKRGFRTANVNLTLVFGLVIYNVVANLLQIPLQAKFPQPAPGAPPTLPAGPWTGLALLLWLILLLIGIFIQGGLLEFTKGAVAKTEPEDIAKFWEGGGKYYLKLMGFGALLFCYIILFIAAAAVIAGLTGLLLRGIPFIRNLIVSTEVFVLVVLAILSILFVVFAPYAIAAQAQGIIGGIKKSIEFVKTNLLKVLGLVGMLILVGVALGVIAGIITGILGAILKGLPVVARVIGALVNGTLNAYILFLGTAALMAFYLAQKSGESPGA